MEHPRTSLVVLSPLPGAQGVCSRYGAINNALEKAIDGYVYTSEYFLNDGDDFHLRLYSAKSKAAVNGAMYNDRTRAEAGLEPTRMVALLNEITEICGLADLSRNQKQLGLKK